MKFRLAKFRSHGSTMAEAESTALYTGGGQEAAKQDRDQDSNTMPTEGKPDINYPTGFVFAIVLLGLMLSMFLVALDMVSHSQPKPYRHELSLCKHE